MPALTWDSTGFTFDASSPTFDATLTNPETGEAGDHYDSETQGFLLIQYDDYVVATGLNTDIEIEESTIDLETATATVSARALLESDEDQFDGVATIIGSSLRIEWPNAGANAHYGKYVWQAKLVDTDGNKKTVIEGPLTLRMSSDAYE